MNGRLSSRGWKRCWQPTGGQGEDVGFLKRWGYDEEQETIHRGRRSIPLATIAEIEARIVWPGSQVSAANGLARRWQPCRA